MRRIAAIVAALFGLAIAMATLAFAESPHFLFASASVNPSAGALVVAFKEAGLGTTVSTEQVTLQVVTATADYQCFNNGGNHPKGGNKGTVSTSLTTSATFLVRNGQTTGTIFAGPPSQGNFACPSGQSLFLQSVTYSDITVSGAAGDSVGATPDHVSSGPIHLLIAA
jgi:hypothetical protein